MNRRFKRVLSTVLMFVLVFALQGDNYMMSTVEAATIKERFVDIFEMKNIENWKMGNYDYLTGEYVEDNNRVCYIESIPVMEGESYVAHINHADYRILVRMYDEEGNYIATSTLANWEKLTIDEMTYTIRLVIYYEKELQSPKSYEEYQSMLSSGFECFLSLQEEEVVSNSALKFVKKMGAGWNLGNALCAVDNNAYGKKSIKYYEKLAYNPVTTKKMIDQVKKMGFKTVRIPVSYKNHMNSKKKIDKKWLARVKQVVDYVIKNDMYCIINLHHEDWLVADESVREATEEELEYVWKQIAAYFSDYSNLLVFEGFNEVINSKNQWDVADAESYAVVNAYNQAFVDAVRATGGKNTKRYLLVKTYAAKATKSVLCGFVLPRDVVDNRLLVGVHIYDGAGGAAYKMRLANQYFVCHGIPVIISEWGQISSAKNTKEGRLTYVDSYLALAKENGLSCIWWDDGGKFKSSSQVNNFALLNRNTCKWYFKSIAKEIVNKSL